PSGPAPRKCCRCRRSVAVIDSWEAVKSCRLSDRESRHSQLQPSTRLTRKRQKLLRVLVIGAVMNVMFTDHSNAWLNPYVFQSAAAEMVRKNVHSSRIFCR